MSVVKRSGIVIYVAGDTADRNLHSQQNHIETVLRAANLQYEMIDIASDPAYKDEMRQRCGNDTAVAPQVFNGLCILSTSSGGRTNKRIFARVLISKTLQ